MHTKTFDPALVRYIVSDTQQRSARSLDLLRAIENTVAINTIIADSFEMAADHTARATESICGAQLSIRKVIDEDGSVVTNIDSAIDILAEAIPILERKREAALNDPQLSLEDGVAESYDKALEALREVCEHTNELKWAILENDADLSPTVPGGPYENVEDFLASLRG